MPSPFRNVLKIIPVFFLIILDFICEIYILTALEIYLGGKNKIGTQLYFSLLTPGQPVVPALLVGASSTNFPQPLSYSELPFMFKSASGLSDLVH